MLGIVSYMISLLTVIKSCVEIVCRKTSQLIQSRFVFSLLKNLQIMRHFFTINRGKFYLVFAVEGQNFFIILPVFFNVNT